MTVRSARRRARSLTLAIGTILGLAVAAATGNNAQAAVVPTVGLGTAGSFGVLGAEAVTNTGPTTITGLDLGVSPGADSKITGFPPGLVIAPGANHLSDAASAQAQAAVTTAYNDAAGRTAAPADQGLTELGGKTLLPGVYQGGELGLTGTVTLDNRTDPDAVFIFQASSSLITSSSSVVAFSAPHRSCNVFWQVTSSATLGTATDFTGTILALASVTAATGATIHGRLFARTGAVTLDTNTITPLPCAAVVPTTSITPSSSRVPPSSSSSSSSSSSTPSITSPTSRTSTFRSPTNPNQSVITTNGSVITLTSGRTSSSSSRRTTGSNSTHTVNSGSTTRTTATTTSPGLAVTGRDLGGPLLVGMLAVLAGGGVMLVATRRRSDRGQHEPGSS